jgi:hypothetical protein
MDETFLDALTEDEAADLHAAGRQRSYGAKTTLFHEGDDAGPVVVLLAGRARSRRSAAPDARRSWRSAARAT